MTILGICLTVFAMFVLGASWMLLRYAKSINDRSMKLFEREVPATRVQQDATIAELQAAFKQAQKTTKIKVEAPKVHLCHDLRCRAVGVHRCHDLDCNKRAA